MKILYLFRHAQAQQNLNNDRVRKLTSQGELEVRQVAEQFRIKNIVPNITLCSTAVRTIQTLDRLQMHSHINFKIEYVDALYNIALDALVNFIRTIDDHNVSTMIVGHNPTINEMSSYLVADRKEIIFGTANLLAMTLKIDSWKEVSSGCAKMDWLITPDLA